MIEVALALYVLETSEVSVRGIVTSRHGRNAATLVSEGKLRSVIQGDRAFGCDVGPIEAGAVELVCGSGRVRLTLVRDKGAPAASPVPVVAAEPPADHTFARADLETRLDREMSRLMTETTLIPVTSRGQVAGFTLSRIPEGTILETLGLRAGDILTTVNDTPIDSFTTLVGLWPRLQAAGSVRAQILRDGRPLDISVSIK